MTKYPTEEQQMKIAFEHWLYLYHLPAEEGIVTERGIEARRQAFVEGFRQGIAWLIRPENCVND